MPSRQGSLLAPYLACASWADWLKAYCHSSQPVPNETSFRPSATPSVVPCTSPAPKRDAITCCRSKPMDNRRSWMAREIYATAAVVERQKDALSCSLRDLLVHLRRRPPAVMVTCARGSSAHAATFGKHLIERYLGLPVAAAAPNIASVYRLSLQLRGQLVLTISQSGRSDDLIAYAASARKSGALTVAITNDPDAPLAKACDIPLPIAAGPEHSIAATKTFVATAAALMRFTAAWAGDAALSAAIGR